MEDAALHRLRSAALSSLPHRKGAKYEERNSFEKLQRKKKKLEAVVRQNRSRHYSKDNGYRYKDALIEYTKTRSFSSSRSSRSASRSSYSSSSSSRSSSTSNSSSGSYSRSNSKSSRSVSPIGKKRAARYPGRERYHEPRKRARYTADRGSPHASHAEVYHGSRNPDRRSHSQYTHAPSHRVYDKAVHSRSKPRYSPVPTQLPLVHDKRSHSRGHRYEHRDVSIRSGRFPDSDKHASRIVEKARHSHHRSREREEYRSPPPAHRAPPPSHRVPPSSHRAPSPAHRVPSGRMDSSEHRWAARSDERRIKSSVRHAPRERVGRPSRRREDRHHSGTERPRREVKGHESDDFVVEDSVVENRQPDLRQVETSSTAIEEDDNHKLLSEEEKEESDALESIGSLGDIAPVDSDIGAEGQVETEGEQLDYDENIEMVENMDKIDPLSSPNNNDAVSPKKELAEPVSAHSSDCEQADNNNNSDTADLSNNPDGKEVRPISSPLRVSPDRSRDGHERRGSSHRIPVKQRLYLSKRKIEERRRQTYESANDLRPSLANRLGPQVSRRNDYQRGGRRPNSVPSKGSAFEIAKAHRRKKRADYLH